MPSTHRRRDETVCRVGVGGVNMNSQLAHVDDCRRIRSTIWKLTKQSHSCLTTWIMIDIANFFSYDDKMTSLLKKLSISITIGVIKRYWVCLVNFQIVDRIRRQSSWTSCELCSHRRRDKTVSSRRRQRCVLGIRMYRMKCRHLSWLDVTKNLTVFFGIRKSDADRFCVRLVLYWADTLPK